MKTFEVFTTYHRTVEANSKEEAEEIAMKDLCSLDGLGGEWVWSEDIDNVDEIKG